MSSTIAAEINILVQLKDQLTTGIKGMNAGLSSFHAQLKNSEATFQSFRNTGAIAFGAITAAAGFSVKAYAESERAQRQLESAVIGVSSGTMEQVEAISDLTEALQKKAGIDGDALKIGAAQLSTFGLQSQSVVDLTKSLADLTVNQNGLGASAQQYEASANIMAKALQGQFGMLEKSGIRFTETQQKMIQFGSESEKVAALQEGLAQNLKETTDTVAGLDLANAKISTSFGEIAEAIGAAIGPAIVSLSESLVPVIDSFAQWASDNPHLIEQLILVGGGIAALVTTVGILGLALGPVITGIQGLMTAFTFMLSPVGLIVLAIGALVAAGYLIVTNWDFIKTKAFEIWEAIKGFFVGVFEAISGVFMSVWESIKNFTIGVFEAISGVIVSVWEGIKTFIATVLGLIASIIIVALEALGVDFEAVWTGISDFFTTLWEGFKMLVSGAVEFIATAISNFLNGISLIWNKIWSGIKTFFSTIWEGMKTLVSTGINFIMDIIKAMVEPIKNVFSNAFDGAVNIVTGAIEMIKNGIKSMVNWVIDKLNFLIQKMNWLIENGVNQLPFVSLATIPEIPKLAEGGLVRKPTLAMVGEGGEPEAVIPLSKLNNFMGGGFLTVELIMQEGAEELFGDRIIKRVALNEKF